MKSGKSRMARIVGKIREESISPCTNQTVSNSFLSHRCFCHTSGSPLETKRHGSQIFKLKYMPDLFIYFREKKVLIFFSLFIIYEWFNSPDSAESAGWKRLSFLEEWVSDNQWLKSPVRRLIRRQSMDYILRRVLSRFLYVSGHTSVGPHP